jgi:hypothetical protein
VVQELEGVAFEGDAPAIVQGLGGTRDLCGVELLVRVWRERCIHIRHERCDRQRVRGRVRRAEKVDDRVAYEI